MHAMAVPSSIELTKESAAVSSPEEINDTPEGAPSKRIKRIFPSYGKVQHGPPALRSIGIDRIAERCPHFRSWIAELRAWSDRGDPASTPSASESPQ